MNHIAPHFSELGDSLRQPPCNYEAERALLGAILLNNRAHERVSEFLRPEHFADPLNGVIYETTSRLIESGRQANPITLKTPLENNDALKAAGGPKYLAGLVSGTVTVINTADYGRVVYDLFLRRELIALGEDVVNDAFGHDPEANIRDVIEGYISGLADMLAAHKGGSGLISLGAAVTQALQRHELVDRGEISGLSTGLQSLDSVLGLLEDGDLTIIAGRPSMGKSALALTILYQVATYFAAHAIRTKAKPKHALFFSQEMTDAESANRVIAALTDIAAPRRRTGPLSSGEWNRLNEARAKVADMPLLIEPTPRATLSRIRTTCRRLQRQGGVGLIVVDYLQIMGTERGRKIENRTQEVTYLATGLKDLAKELRCPVIALSQLNRAVEQREDKRPNLSDLRESGEIEAAADSVAFCYRDQYYLERTEPKQKPEESADRFHDRYAKWQEHCTAAHGKAEIIVAKARHGVCGTAKLDFDGARTWFSDPAGLPRPAVMTHQRPEPIYSAMPDGRPEPPPVGDI